MSTFFSINVFSASVFSGSNRYANVKWSDLTCGSKDMAVEMRHAERNVTPAPICSSEPPPRAFQLFDFNHILTTATPWNASRIRGYTSAPREASNQCIQLFICLADNWNCDKRQLVYVKLAKFNSNYLTKTHPSHTVMQYVLRSSHHFRWQTIP